MKNFFYLIIATFFTGLTSAKANTIQFIQVKHLDLRGYNREAILKNFRDGAGIQLDLNETLLVDMNDEGKTIRFETFDDFVINLPIEWAAASWNKND